MQSAKEYSSWTKNKLCARYCIIILRLEVIGVLVVSAAKTKIKTNGHIVSKLTEDILNLKFQAD